MGKSLTDKILILDLDNCLLYAHEDKHKTRMNELMKPENMGERHRVTVANIVPKGHKREVIYSSTARPDLHRFFEFAKLYFETIIFWSAADPDYVHKFVNLICRGSIEPDLILTREHIEYVGPPDSQGHRDYHKPLTVLKKLYPAYYDPKRILFLDDKEDNFRDNVDNGLVIPEYEGKKTEDNDSCLLSLMDWLMTPEVIKSTDVRKLNKEHVFDRYNSKVNRDEIYDNIINKLPPGMRFIH